MLYKALTHRQLKGLALPRKLRYEIPGCYYHVMARGNEKADIFLDDDDYEKFLTVMANTIKRCNWYCHAYCLMPNHYHLLIELNEKTLSRGLQYLNSVYAQAFNRRHTRVGHLYQGRAKTPIIEKNSHFFELTRYIALNPVRARLTRKPEDWPWSSYRATIGLEPCPDYITSDGILINYGDDRLDSIRQYRRFVADGHNQPSPYEKVKHPAILGSDRFIQEILKETVDNTEKLIKRPVESLNTYKTMHLDQNNAMSAAYHSGHYTLKQIGEFFRVSKSTVSRSINGVRPPTFHK